MHAKVLVTLRPGVLDPAGQAVADGLRQLGFGEVLGVRIGKVLEIELDDASGPEARARLEEMSQKLLANTVIEQFEVELGDS
jgi:phosphoribosylformylglycinamidine synthase